MRCPDVFCDLGTVLNVSASGIQIATPKPIAAGTEFSFAIEGPDAPVNVCAIAVRCTRSGRGFEVAFAFTDLSREAARGLTTIARLAATATETLRPS